MSLFAFPSHLIAWTFTNEGLCEARTTIYKGGEPERILRLRMLKSISKKPILDIAVIPTFGNPKELAPEIDVTLEVNIDSEHLFNFRVHAVETRLLSGYGISLLSVMSAQVEPLSGRDDKVDRFLEALSAGSGFSLIIKGLPTLGGNQIYQGDLSGSRKAIDQLRLCGGIGRDSGKSPQDKMRLICSDKYNKLVDLNDGNRVLHDFGSKSDCSEGKSRIERGSHFCDYENNTLRTANLVLVHDFEDSRSCREAIPRANQGLDFCDYTTNTLLSPSGKTRYQFNTSSGCRQALN